MRKTCCLILSLLPAIALGAVTSVVTPRAWDLYAGTSILTSGHATEAVCLDAARARPIAVGQTITYSCRTRTNIAVTGVPDPVPTPDPTPTPVPAPAPPPSGPVTIMVSPATMAVGGYSTISWRGASNCVASSVPDYAAWSGAKQSDWSQSVSPTVTTTLTITCSDGSASTVLTVTGTAPAPTPDPTPGPTPDPVPTPGPLPIPPINPTAYPSPLPLLSGTLADPWLNYAETASRNWSFGGHHVPVPFTEDQGYWDYTDHFYASWLFDRPSSWYQLWVRTGDARWRTLFESDLAYYASQISAAGYFLPKERAGEQDTKYGYTRPFALYEKLTGDTRYHETARRVYQASLGGFDNVYSPGAGLWTEREMWIHMETALSWYDMSGDVQALARAKALVTQWTTMSGTRGAPMVSYDQHEGGGPGGTSISTLVSSPWMAGLYFQAARHYYEITGESEVLAQASAYFDFANQPGNAFYDGALAHPNLAGITLPRYLFGTLTGEGGYGEETSNHCPAMQGLLRFVVYAKSIRGEDTSAAQARMEAMDRCTAWRFGSAPPEGGLERTADQYPRYRIQNPRFWMLWTNGAWERWR